ncbi:MAG: hypothetical protein K6G52_08450 [Treponemataceae bacterium]|nr:hypothetical protein [Treponemataceae bacterium]
MKDYQKYADKARSKLKTYGSPIIINRIEQSQYNDETDEYEETTVEITGYAIQRNFDQRNIDGTNIKFGDVLFMASVNGEPKSNDTVKFQGNDYTVIDVKAMNPNGKTAIFYNIQAR